jgi:hypothetical protein
VYTGDQLPEAIGDGLATQLLGMVNMPLDFLGCQGDITGFIDFSAHR